MAKAMTVEEPLGIETIEDLRRAIRDVQEHNEPVVIQVEDASAAVLSPPKRPKRRKMTPVERKKADYEAFLSSAGGWERLFDPEEFKKLIKAGRGSHRPPVVFDPPEE